MTPALPRAALALAPLVFATPALPQASDHSTRAIEVTVKVRDEAPRCEPQELRVPADANIDLRVQNLSRTAVSLNAPDLFQDDRVRSSTGATKAEGGALVVDPGASAQVLVLTPPQGRYSFACTRPGAPDPSSTGSLTTVR